MPAESSPERDRYLANQVRHGPRYARSASTEAKRWLGGPEGRRLRRNRALVGALKEVLSDSEMAKIEPLSVIKGTLTLGVADNLLLSELRTMRHQQLIGSLLTAGTGINKIVYRLQRS